MTKDTRVTVAAHEPPSLLPPNLYDIRAQAAHLGKVDAKVMAKRGSARDWDGVTGICLHQTATVLGENPDRWASLGAHIGVTRAGKILWVHDFDRIIYHGNGWNTRTVGIEIDGRYCGVEGDERTFWRPKENPEVMPQKLTPETVEAAKKTIRWVHQVVANNGGQIRFLVAHRQSSESRRSDPGSAIWQEIALPISAELSLNDGGQGFKIGAGYPIPEAWNPAYVGEKY